MMGLYAGAAWLVTALCLAANPHGLYIYPISGAVVAVSLTICAIIDYRYSE